MVADGLSDSKSTQVSRTLLSILAVLNNVEGLDSSSDLQFHQSRVTQMIPFQ